jgi:hypothetical protein
VRSHPVHDEMYSIQHYVIKFVRRVFLTDSQHSKGTNCASLLVDLFLYSYEEDVIQGLLKTNEKKIASYFNFTFRYIDEGLSLSKIVCFMILVIASLPLRLK